MRENRALPRYQAIPNVQIVHSGVASCFFNLNCMPYDDAERAKGFKRLTGSIEIYGGLIACLLLRRSGDSIVSVCRIVILEAKLVVSKFHLQITE